MRRILALLFSVFLTGCQAHIEFQTLEELEQAFQARPSGFVTTSTSETYDLQCQYLPEALLMFRDGISPTTENLKTSPYKNSHQFILKIKRKDGGKMTEGEWLFGLEKFFFLQFGNTEPIQAELTMAMRDFGVSPWRSFLVSFPAATSDEVFDFGHLKFSVFGFEKDNIDLHFVLPFPQLIFKPTT